MRERNHWMILYDIRCPSRLRHVEKCISSYGWRIQKSIFESDAEEFHIRQMKKRLDSIIKDDDSILIFRVCERDWQKRELYGKATKGNPMGDKFMIL